jgi:hypothetical protein
VFNLKNGQEALNAMQVGLTAVVPGLSGLIQKNLSLILLKNF